MKVDEHYHYILDAVTCSSRYKINSTDTFTFSLHYSFGGQRTLFWAEMNFEMSWHRVTWKVFLSWPCRVLLWPQSPGSWLSWNPEPSNACASMPGLRRSRRERQQGRQLGSPSDHDSPSRCGEENTGKMINQCRDILTHHFSYAHV